MAKTVNRLALQQSLVRNGLAEDPAAGNVADDWGDEIDEVTADLATKEDLDKAVERIEHRLSEEISALRLDMERRDKERAERESEWWRLQQERDDERQREQQARDDVREKRDEEWRKEQREREDKWRAEQQKRDEAREKRDEEWRKEMQARDDARQKRDDDWRREQQKRDDDWRKEQRERDDEARQREVEAAKAASSQTSKILWAIFGATGVIGTVVGIVVAVT